MKRQLLAFGLLAASTLGTLGIVTSAQAGSPLKISALHCEGTGGGIYLCFAQASGGSGSYKYDWNTGPNASILEQSDTNKLSHIKGKCKIGTKPSIKVTAKDRLGKTAGRSTSFKCASIAL